MRIRYNHRLTALAKKLRNDSTQAEIKLWKELQNKQLYGYKFTRQKPIGNYIVDFYCNKLKLTLEVDGYSHTFEEVLDKDEEKQLYLENLGLTVLRFDDDEVMKDMDNVMRVLERYVLEFENKNSVNSLLKRRVREV